jgi:hypothetical protein
VHCEKPYFDSWYGAFFKGRGDTIHYVTRYHACADDYGDDYHLERRVHLYYLRRDPDGKWRNIAGDELRLPLDLTSANQYCRIWQSEVAVGTGKLITVGDFRFDSDKADNPYIVFSYGQTKCAKENRKYLLAIGDRNSGRFTFIKVPAVGILTAESQKNITILTSRHLHTTRDEGKTWTLEKSGLKTDVAHLTPLLNPHPDARVLATEPRPYPNERRIKLYLWGDHGFLKASAKEPNQALQRKR